MIPSSSKIMTIVIRRAIPYPCAMYNAVSLMDRSEITDINGRHIPVVHRKLPEDIASEATSRPSGPRNAWELSKRLETLSRLVRHADTVEARRDIAHGLKRLAEWAMGA